MDKLARKLQEAYFSLEQSWSTKNQKHAVIIKGNPKRITNGDLYDKLEDFLKQKGFKVTFDDGKPHTSPDETADVWIGHSRGADRLRFAPDNIKTIAMGSDLEGSINHPNDKVDIDPDEFDDLPDEVKKAHNSWHLSFPEKLNKIL